MPEVDDDKPQIVEAATILMVREIDGFEVLMVQRHHQIEFAGGAIVFPGGKVDSGDRDPAWAPLLDGALADPIATSLRIAAIREAYEESGLLLARPATRRGVGRPLLHPDEAPGLFADQRGEQPPGAFREMIAEAGLVLAIDALTNFANWLTPDVPKSVMPKRFDTHFFLAVAPPDQTAACDGHEAVDALWIGPGQALEEAAAGQRVLAFPTRMNLEMLSRATSAAEATAQASARPAIKVTPRMDIVDGEKVISIPAEAGYSIVSEKLAMLVPKGAKLPAM